MSEDSIFREVNEELRSDRMRNLWRRYGVYVIGAAVGVVLLVGLSEGWSWWQSTHSARSSELLYKALDSAEKGDFAEAQKALATTEAEGAGGYPVLAKFREAEMLLQQGKNQEAAAMYDALASASNETRLRELATVLGAMALVDTGDVDAVKGRVEGILAVDSPLANSAREAIGLTQYKTGQLADARKSFEQITASPTASQVQRSRIEVYLAQLSAEGVGPAKPDQANPDQAAPAADAGAPAAAAPAEAAAPASGN